MVLSETPSGSIVAAAEEERIIGTAASKGSLPRWMVVSSIALVMSLVVGIVLLKRSRVSEATELDRPLFEFDQSILYDSSDINDMQLARRWQEIERVVHGFVEADSIEQRLVWSRQVPKLREKMEAQLQRDSNSWMMGEVTNVEQVKFIYKDGVMRQVIFAYLEDGAIWELSLIEQGGELRVDWEAAEVYQERPWEEFLRSPPGTVGEFRLLVNAAGSYFEPFAEKDYLAALLKPPRCSEGPLVYGYVDRGGPVFSEKIEFLRQVNEVSQLSQAGLRSILKLRKAGEVGGIKLVEILEVKAQSFVRGYADHSEVDG
jgi:hypothetical protein